ncbi:hypothetical protein [Streptomyces erythrochromogenes]|uniref:hypothetical protein n=1 Tax=Streptomyces erythrochromogenes TaxID=285574 RepID=UPI0037CF15AB
MAAKVTVGDVLAAGERVGQVGKGQTPHLVKVKGMETEAACNGKGAAPSDEFNAEINLCANCAKLFAANPNNTEETNTMAETTETKQTADEIAAEVKGYVENLLTEVFPKLTKDDKVKIEATYEQAEKELLRVSANKRAVFRTQLKEAKASAMERNGAAAVVLHAETTDLDSVEGIKEIIDHTAEKMADGIRAELTANETARILAESILDARLRIYDKKGRPDLKGTRQQSKDLTGRIKSAAAHKLVDSGFKDSVADVDDLMESLQAKITYQMSDVLPQFVRSLDQSPEQFAELFPMYVDKVTDDKPASDLIFEEYKINPLSQKERSAANRAKNQLANDKPAGELEGGEGEGGEGEGEGEGTPDTSQFDKDMSALDKMIKNIPTIAGHVKDYTDEQRTAARDKYTALLSAISDALKPAE